MKKRGCFETSHSDGVHVPTPELDKMAEARPKTQAAHDFMEFLREKGYVLAKYHEHSEECDDRDGYHECGLVEDQLYQDHKPEDDLLAEWQGIDMKKIEAERRAILAALR